MSDRCSIPGCRAEVDLTYLGHGICTPHWNEFTADDVPPDALRMVLGIEVAEPAKETDMAKKTTTEAPAPVAADTTPEPQAAPAPARRRKKTTGGDTAPHGAAPAETPPAESTPAPKKKRTKAAAAPEGEAPAPPRKERPAKETLVVFACRVAEHERVKFHEATGPGGATRFARKLMVVFSNEDEPGFHALLKEAREVRA